MHASAQSGSWSAYFVSRSSTSDQKCRSHWPVGRRSPMHGAVYEDAAAVPAGDASRIPSTRLRTCRARRRPVFPIALPQPRLATLDRRKARPRMSYRSESSSSAAQSLEDRGGGSFPIMYGIKGGSSRSRFDSIFTGKGAFAYNPICFQGRPRATAGSRSLVLFFSSGKLLVSGKNPSPSFSS
jgi:hypothetical protein